ncbi:MAG TPA: toll/interleukin-1 receptor domain-containing protein [Myxococcaceae bacterium]|nr:toll/interleukin-1 receptor domain-containing protein [Myxococcaceae bacterium]
MPYCHELFLSYPNIPLVTDWLDEFLPPFRQWLRQMLLERRYACPDREDHRSLIFRDDQIRVGQDWPEVLRRAARDSRCVLAIVLPEYWQSPHCRAEWKTFTVRGPNLTLPIRFFDSVDELSGRQFFDLSDHTYLLKGTVPWMEFLKQVKELAREVAEAIIEAPPYPEGPHPEHWVALEVPEAPLPRHIKQGRL